MVPVGPNSHRIAQWWSFWHAGGRSTCPGQVVSIMRDMPKANLFLPWQEAEHLGLAEKGDATSSSLLIGFYNYGTWMKVQSSSPAGQQWNGTSNKKSQNVQAGHREALLNISKQWCTNRILIQHGNSHAFLLVDLTGFSMPLFSPHLDPQDCYSEENSQNHCRRVTVLHHVQHLRRSMASRVRHACEFARGRTLCCERVGGATLLDGPRRAGAAAFLGRIEQPNVANIVSSTWTTLWYTKMCTTRNLLVIQKCVRLGSSKKNVYHIGGGS